jgi:hypothetical protein
MGGMADLDLDTQLLLLAFCFTTTHSALSINDGMDRVSCFVPMNNEDFRGMESLCLARLALSNAVMYCTNDLT